MIHTIECFAEIAQKYKAIFCDLWGCLHNGKESFQKALEALYDFRRAGGYVLLLTNAPRPSDSVIKFLNQLGVTSKYYDDIITSGDATRLGLQSGKFGCNIFHIGPAHDLCFFDLNIGINMLSKPINLVPISQASSIVCTGLFDDKTEEPCDYKSIISAGIEYGLTLLCANPDIQVDYGHQRLWCAGAIAADYTKAGGLSIYFGKPHKPIYDAATNKLKNYDPSIKKSEIICVGDGIRTDILGGMSYGLDTLFVTGGLASEETGTYEGARSPDEKKLRQFFERTKLTPTTSINYFQ